MDADELVDKLNKKLKEVGKKWVIIRK
jgi:hypothetical protein